MQKIFQIVDECLSEDKLMSTTLEMAKKLAPRGEDRKVYGAIKREWHTATYGFLVQESLGEGGKMLNARM